MLRGNTSWEESDGGGADDDVAVVVGDGDGAIVTIYNLCAQSRAHSTVLCSSLCLRSIYLTTSTLHCELSAPPLRRRHRRRRRSHYRLSRG